MKILCNVFNRRVAVTLLVILLVVSGAVVVNFFGIKLAGDVPAWESWLKDNAPVFFVWRLLLYAGTAYSWLWMRMRVMQRESAPDGANRLRRVEICAVASIVLLEVTNFLGQG